MEAIKKTAIVLNVKFVKENSKKFDANVSMISNQTPEVEGAAQAGKKENAGDVFKAFMQGKLDDQARMEVLAKAKQLRLEKMQMMTSLKDKLEEDLHFAKESNRAQKMKNYFERQRLKSELARRKRAENLAIERKHKVALMNKMEITKYLRKEENLRLLKLKRSEYFTRQWVGAAYMASGLSYIRNVF